MARARYFEAFHVVELQQTFYQPPKPALAEKWRAESPAGFEYTLKAWQLITHGPESPTYRKLKEKIPALKEKYYGSFRPTDEVFSAWERTREIAEILHARVIVFQCPASFRPAPENKRNIERFFSSIDRGKLIFAWEPRGQWRGGDIYALCKELELAHAVDPFRNTPAYGKIRYYRLHGMGGYRYRYTREDLEKLRGIVGKEPRSVETYVLFNNVYMHEDALEFMKLWNRKERR